ncbi:MAG: M81 family metallopeptidase [Myxococcota bacterium]
MKRIGYVRIAQESNAGSPVLTELVDFERSHLLAGATLHGATMARGVEVKGFLNNAELSGFRRAVEREGGGQVVAVPLFSAWAISGGPLSADCFAHFRSRLRSALEAAAPLDGLFFALHGAMGAVGTLKPEVELLRVAREVLGDAVPIVCTMDLHAQITADDIRLADAICGFRTNPHRDHRAVGQRAGGILVDLVLGRMKATVAWRSLPMVTGGGTTVDIFPTMRPLFRKMQRMERDPRVRYVSLFMCHLWNDHPDLGWSTVVVTDDDAALAERLAEELADAAWKVRKVEPPRFDSPEEAIAKVRKARTLRRLGTVCICDASDVVGAGGTGENTRILAALLEQAPELMSYVPVRDPEFIATHWEKEEGAAVETTLGGTLHPELNAPLPVRGTLGPARKMAGIGRCRVLRLGNVSVVVTEGPSMAMKPAFYRDMGLPPAKADICVVRSFFPFRIYFLAHSRMNIYVQTEGITDRDAVQKLQFNDPVYPKDDVADWRIADRRRRGLTRR